MIPLHNHSEYSALDGLGTCEEIADRIAELNLCGCAITDHGLVCGHRDFAKHMLAKGLKPIYGIEAYQAKDSRLLRPDPVPYVDTNGKNRTKTPRDAAHLILLAQNATGLRNLNILSDEANRTGFYFAPRLDWELLERYNEGIIATSACLSGLVAKELGMDSSEALDNYLRIFGDRFYVELHTYSAEKQRKTNHALVRLAQERGIPLVYASDAHFCKPEDYFTHEMILNMQMKSNYHSAKNVTVDGDVDEDYSHDGSANCYHPKSLYIMGEAEVRAALDYLPRKVVDEAISNSDLIASQCNVELPETRMHMPVFKMPESATVEFPDDNQLALLELAEEGLVERYGDPLPQEVIDRFEMEYETLTNVNLGESATLGDYFLINWDWICNFCKPNSILTGPGRGSAGGSILAYALGITHIDPIKYTLQFERFWNAGRATGFPDIDTDVEQGRRQEVKEYLIDKYGEDKVLSIGTHVKHQPKSALDSVAKAWFGKDRMKSDGLYDVVNKIKEIIESESDAGKQPTWEHLWNTVGDQLEQFRSRSKDWETIFDLAEKITGRISTYGIHPSAVVISDVSLPDVMPCRSAKPPTGSKERQLVTQIHMHEVEDIGFLKLDLLGLRNLDTLALTAKLANMEDFNWWTDIDYDNLDYKLLESGQTLGLFQVEEGNAAKRIAKKINAGSLMDLAAIIALNRPGPLRSGAVDRYLARKRGEEATVYPHPFLEDILGHTYGEMIYQEDVLAFFRKIGYNLSEADNIRWMMGKKKVEAMKAEYPRYCERFKSFGATQEDCDLVWDLMADFSKYGFNVPHAYCYGKILAATIYAKGK